MNLKFYLRKDKTTKHGDFPVYSLITFSSQRIRKPVKGVHCNEQLWDPKKERIRKPPRTKSDDIDRQNNRLSELKSTFDSIAREVFESKIAVSEKYILDRLANKALLVPQSPSFFALVEKYLEAIRPVCTPSTLRSKRHSFNFIKDFASDSHLKTTLASINYEWFEALRNFAFEQRQVGDNYFARIIRCLKTFLNWAVEHKHMHNFDFKKFKATEKETEIICLTIEEFQRLATIELKDAKLDRVRDIFIFGCATGLRFSDLQTLKPTDIRGEFIVKSIEKTKETNTIPINKHAKSILEKYKHSTQEPIPRIAQQKYNRYIKECCKIAGIDTPIAITRFAGGTKTQMTYPKYQLISSHTARKTFITLSLILGGNERVVRSITSHKKEESFRRYVKFSKEFEKKQMDEIWSKI